MTVEAATILEKVKSSELGHHLLRLKETKTGMKTIKSILAMKKRQTTDFRHSGSQMKNEI